MSRSINIFKLKFVRDLEKKIRLFTGIKYRLQFQMSNKINKSKRKTQNGLNNRCYH